MTMNPQEFLEAIRTEPSAETTLSKAGMAVQPQQFGGAAEAAAIMVMFPIVKYMLTNIGLPWLHEFGRFSELHRQRVARWIDERHDQHGLDPAKAKEASRFLISELEKTADADTKLFWRELAKHFNSKDGEE